MIKDFNFKTELLTIKKLHIIRLAAIFFLSIFMFLLVSGNSIQAKTDTTSQTYKNLMGGGISSIHEWGNCENSELKLTVYGRVEVYRKVLADGWRHLNFTN